MLETYFVKPTTIDRIRASWIGAEVERYVVWLEREVSTARCGVGCRWWSRSVSSPTFAAQLGAGLPDTSRRS